MAWQWHYGRDAVYLTIPAWQSDGVSVSFSSRLKGHSDVPYNGLNLGLHVGDRSGAVFDNRRDFFAELGADSAFCVAAQQVHGGQIVWVDAGMAGCGMDDLASAVQGTDGMLTDEKCLWLVSFYADCVPLLFFHPGLRVVGWAHAGWKGTAVGIGERMLERLALLGGSPEECLVAIGPCIHVCCYEVDEQVYGEFALRFSAAEMARVFQPAASGKYRLNLAEANRLRLLAAGAVSENILMAPYCTFCEEVLFFSHRRHQPTGRMAAMIALLH